MSTTSTADALRGCQPSHMTVSMIDSAKLIWPFTAGRCLSSILRNVNLLIFLLLDDSEAWIDKNLPVFFYVRTGSLCKKWRQENVFEVLADSWQWYLILTTAAGVSSGHFLMYKMSTFLLSSPCNWWWPFMQNDLYNYHHNDRCGFSKWPERPLLACFLFKKRWCATVRVLV